MWSSRLSSHAALKMINAVDDEAAESDVEIESESFDISEEDKESVHESCISEESVHTSDDDFINDDSDDAVEPEKESTKDAVKRFARLLGSASNFFDEFTGVPDAEMNADMKECVEFSQKILNRCTSLLATKPKKRLRVWSE